MSPESGSRHALMDRSPAPMAELGGAAHLVRYANPAFCALTGKSREALAGKPFAEAMRDGGGCLAVLDRVYRTGEAESHAELEHPDSPAPFRSYAIWPVLDKEQRPAGVMMQVTETTRFQREASAMNEALLISSVRQHELTDEAETLNDRLRGEMARRLGIENSLRESEESYRTLFAAAPMAVFVCDRNGVIQQYNERAVELWGREPVRGVERHCGSLKLWLPDGAPLPHTESPVVEVLRSGVPVLNVEVFIERPDGSRLPVLVNFAPLTNAAREVTGAITSFTDISDRKRAEVALRQAMEFGEAVMAGMNEGLYTTDAQGLVTSMNPAAEDMFGWRFEELRGRKMHDVTHHHRPDGTPFPVEHCAGFQVLESGKPVTGHEDSFIRKDGSFFPVIYSAAPLRGAEGIMGLVVVFRDIAERQRAEERERLLAREVAHRSKNLLSVFQAIVSRSLAGTRSLGEAREALMRRIQALARSQIVLESGGFESARFTEILRLEVETFSERVRANGPDVRLNPRAAQTFALVVHELVTNATKYGALSQPGGRVAVNWSINGANELAKFDFQWQEFGGPAVAPPTRQGFGRVLIEKVVAQEFGAQPKISFAPEGLRYEIVAPLSLVAAGGTN